MFNPCRGGTRSGLRYLAEQPTKKQSEVMPDPLAIGVMDDETKAAHIQRQNAAKISKNVKFNSRVSVREFNEDEILPQQPSKTNGGHMTRSRKRYTDFEEELKDADKGNSEWTEAKKKALKKEERAERNLKIDMNDEGKAKECGHYENSVGAVGKRGA